MNDILFLIQFVGATILIVAPAILINRLLARSVGGTLADLFAIPLDPPWPRGVQEEEPFRWRVEALRPPTREGDRTSDPVPQRRNARSGQATAQGEPMLPVSRSTP